MVVVYGGRYARIGLELIQAPLHASFGIPQATIYIAGFLTIIYGYREKHRTRFNECHHFGHCPLILITYLVKSAIFIIAVLAFVISITCFAFALTVYVMLFAADKTCEFGQETAVIILDSISTQDVWEVDDEFEIDDGTLDKICKQVNEALHSGKVATIGGIILLHGQVAVLCYFFKYSTLSLVTPYELDKPDDLNP